MGTNLSKCQAAVVDLQRRVRQGGGRGGGRRAGKEGWERSGGKGGEAGEHLQATKPPTPTGIMGASDPPAMMMSASPFLMWLAAATKQ